MGGSVHTLALYGRYVYAGRYFTSIGSFEQTYFARFDISSGSNILIDNKLPKSYLLYQNYPNSFNPTTNIQFSILEAGNVKLTIYNILGQKVETLVNDYKDAGTYTVNWNAENLPSGVYIYKLESNSKILVNKMTLLKYFLLMLM